MAVAAYFSHCFGFGVWFETKRPESLAVCTDGIILYPHVHVVPLCLCEKWARERHISDQAIIC